MQAGGHRFDPGQLHQLSFGCFPMAAIADGCDREAGCDLRMAAGFISLRAGLARRKSEVLMFDNEIDWVTQLESCMSAERRTGQQQTFPRAYTYKAEHKQ